MLANEGNPLERRNHLIRERLEKVRAERSFYRACRSGVWIAGGLVLVAGIELITGLGWALIMLGFWALITAALMERPK